MKRIDNLASYIEENSFQITETGCWIWTKAWSHFGYGIDGVKNGEVVAHRTSWKAFVGPIPEGMCVLHKCDVPPCVNPRHLFIGTKAENNADKKQKGRSAKSYPNRRGLKNWKATLEENDVHEIRASDLPQKTLADRYHVSQPTIAHIKSGRYWKWLPWR